MCGLVPFHPAALFAREPSSLAAVSWCPILRCSMHRVAAVPAAKQVPDVEVEKLAEGMQRLAESRVAADKCSKLCCRVAEIDAMEREERPLQEARAKEKARLAKEKAILEKEARALEATRAREALVQELIRTRGGNPRGEISDGADVVQCLSGQASNVRIQPEPTAERPFAALCSLHSSKQAGGVAVGQSHCSKHILFNGPGPVAMADGPSIPQALFKFTEWVKGLVLGSPLMRVQVLGSFPPGLMQFLRDAGFQKPTTLQAYAWPSLMQGKDMIAITASGQGKSLSYLLPSYIKLKRAESEGRLRRNVHCGHL